MSFRHLMFYVKDLSVSRPFYDAVLGHIAYSLAHGSETYAMWMPQDGGVGLGLSQSPADLAELPPHRGAPGLHHLAFNATDRDQIDSLYRDVLLPLKTQILDPPVACPEYSSTYYAVYFTDPDGLKLEVAHS
jgi:glyoxylase I family protein